MNLSNTLTYHWNVNILGKSVLRYHRLKNTYFKPAKAKWSAPYLTPPLNISAWTKELVGRHYLKGNFVNQTQKVVWVTSGAPVEFLKALDYYILYPENHGAVCGTLRVAEEICTLAEDNGYSKDICSYARTDIGSMLSGKTPVGKLPKPDLLLACTNICQTVLHWYRVLAHHFKVPLILIDTPFLYDEAKDHDIAFVKKQIEDAIPVAEKVAGKSLDFKKLKNITRYAQKATYLWAEILSRAESRPAPISVFDQFIQMAPIVELRGEAVTVDFYAAMLKEIDHRISKGIGAVVKEKKRLLWDNLPIWYRMRYLADFFGQHGIVISASTYTNAWGELADFIDAEKPIESAALTYIHPILNRSTGHKLKIMTMMFDKYKLDGAILHSDRSCKPYSIGQLEQRERIIRHLGKPALLLEADHNDPRSYTEDTTANRLSAFIEMLES